ncbi:unnamed protein product [Caenorhabditis sp. 36 PRJEB53466]|nr:unnamed protein product [Caenorhabditis sp. 36 PRJEB53466]
MPERLSAGGDNFETDDKIFRTATSKNFLLVYILWNTILAIVFLSLNLCTEKSISIIFALPFIGTVFVFVFALKMKSKLIFGIFAVYTIISLSNTFFKMCMGLSDGDWFERCFYGPIESFQSIITILHSIFQVLIAFVLIRMSFWEMDASCCCCNCCFFCCCCCPCFDEKRQNLKSPSLIE